MDGIFVVFFLFIIYNNGMNKGKLHIYTGDGKGKTTSAIGLAIRAAGAGFKVAFVQFDKGWEGEEFYSERKILRKIENIDLFPTGTVRHQKDGSFRFNLTEDDIKEAKRGLEISYKILKEKKYDLVILDEIIVSIYTKLLKLEDVLSLIKFWKENCECELVLTGRYAPEEILKEADLVTEMKKIKHYFDKGVKAKKGIEF